jgi:hypothetical protein
MRFLYVPPQTYMPYAAPRPAMDQDAYNARLQAQFTATQRVAPSVPRSRVDELQALAELYRSGVLTEAEFAAEKSRLLREASGR